MADNSEDREVLVEVDGVAKKYCRHLKKSLWYGVKDIWQELVIRNRDGSHELREDEFWAVRNVSFQVRRGQCLGLIGPNGAGKSTLLKLLNGLIKPDKGRITMRGRVGALIELGAGFNPILSGRENIYNCGSILGLRKREMDEKFDSIVSFAELEDFINSPVQNYSSGMKVRLGFSVASHLDPDVLLIDEVLAVGDIGFRTKCFNVIDRMCRRSAIIFVSHIIPQVSRICTNLMVLKPGEVQYLGDDVAAGIQLYFSQFHHGEGLITGNGKAEIRNIRVNGDDYDPHAERDIAVNYLDELTLSMTCRLHADVRQASVFVTFFSRDLQPVAQTSSGDHDFYITNTDKPVSCRASFPRLQFSPGPYSVDIVVRERLDNNRSGEILVHNHGAVRFVVVGTSMTSASLKLCGIWEQMGLGTVKK